MIDPRGGAYTVGFGIVEHLAVFTHYTATQDHLWDRARDLLPSDATLVGLPEATALIRDAHGAWSATGMGSVTTVRNGVTTTTVEGPIIV